MKNSKIFFPALLVFVISLGLWMGGKFLINLHYYFLFSQDTLAQVNEWNIREINPGKFVIDARYEFKVDDRVYYNQYYFLKPVYKNEYLPKTLIERWKNNPQKVWYNLKSPHVATLQKKFPFKEGVYFVVCLGVFLYFSWLRIYVQKNFVA